MRALAYYEILHPRTSTKIGAHTRARARTDEKQLCRAKCALHMVSIKCQMILDYIFIIHTFLDTASYPLEVIDYGLRSEEHAFRPVYVEYGDSSMEYIFASVFVRSHLVRCGS